MGSFDVLGFGLFRGRIDKRWNFNGCGDFVGRFFGGGGAFLGWLEVVEKVGVVVVFGGRAWVSSLPKFFLGKYFQFWKPPPLFCINS